MSSDAFSEYVLDRWGRVLPGNNFGKNGEDILECAMLLHRTTFF